MNKERKTNLIIAAAAAILVAVGIFTLFAYGVSQGTEGNNGWNVFHLMFGKGLAVDKQHLGTVCGGLLVAFIFQCVVFLGVFIAAFFSGKIGSLAFIINAALLVTAGILYLNTIKFWYAANVYASTSPDKAVLGAGPICSAVFSFVPALLCVYAAYKNFKA